MTKRDSHEGRSPSAMTPTVPRLQRRTLRQLTVVELGKVAGGRRCIPTTAIENECVTRDDDP